MTSRWLFRWATVLGVVGVVLALPGVFGILVAEWGDILRARAWKRLSEENGRGRDV